MLTRPQGEQLRSVSTSLRNRVQYQAFDRESIQMQLKTKDDPDYQIPAPGAARMPDMEINWLSLASVARPSRHSESKELIPLPLIMLVSPSQYALCFLWWFAAPFTVRSPHSEVACEVYIKGCRRYGGNNCRLLVKVVTIHDKTEGTPHSINSSSCMHVTPECSDGH